MQESKYPWLDWVRFVAALLVVVSHIKWLVFNHNTSLPSYGNEAVILFFVLSGYLVGGKAFQRLNNGTFEVRSYSIDRISRIFTPLLPALVFTLIVSVVLTHNFQDLSFVEAIKVTWKNNAVLWSLVYEIVFYVMVASCSLPPRLRLLAAAIFGLIFCRLYLHYLICWLIGAMAYFIPKEKNYAILGGAIILIIIGSYLTQSYRYEGAFMFLIENARIFIAVGGGLLITQLINFRMNPHASKIGNALAAFSYTLYLVHFPLLYLYAAKSGGFLNTTPVWTFFFVIAGCFGFAWIMYFLFEKNTSVVRDFLEKSIPIR